MENEATRHPVLEDDRRDLTFFMPLKSEDDQNSQGLRAKIDFSDIQGECKSMNGVDKRKIDDVEWTMAVNLGELLLLNDEKPPTTGIKDGQEDRVRRLQTTVYVDNKELMLIGEDKPAVRLVKDTLEVGFVAAVVCKNELMLLEEETPMMMDENTQPTENIDTRTNIEDFNDVQGGHALEYPTDSQEYAVTPTPEMFDVQQERAMIVDTVSINHMTPGRDVSRARAPSNFPELTQTPTETRPQKPLPRRAMRVILDAVEVPTLASLKQTGRSRQVVVKREPTEERKVLVKTEPLTEDDFVKLEFLHSNPNVKIKKEEVLSDEGVGYRLKAFGPGGLDPLPIDLPDDIKNATVTRAWMANTFGGSVQTTHPTIDKKKFPHGLDDFCYMTYDFNPNAPKVPGSPGLRFGIGDGGLEKMVGSERVIMCTRSPRWTYMGMYRSTPSSPLTKDEWSAQSDKFQNCWARKISEKEWGIKVRNRVGLRHRLGREPTKKEVKKAMDNDKYKKLSPELIKQDFASGKEKIGVWCMKCTGYDKEFQHKLAAMPVDWVPPTSDKPKKGKTKAGPKKKAADEANAPGPAKRKRRAQVDDLISEEEEDQPDEQGIDDVSKSDGDDIEDRPRRKIKASLRPDANYANSPMPSRKRRRYITH